MENECTCSQPGLPDGALTFYNTEFVLISRPSGSPVAWETVPRACAIRLPWCLNIDVDVDPDVHGDVHICQFL